MVCIWQMLFWIAWPWCQRSRSNILKNFHMARNTNSSYNFRWRVFVFSTINAWCEDDIKVSDHHYDIYVKGQAQTYLKYILSSSCIIWWKVFKLADWLLIVSRWQRRFQITNLTLDERSSQIYSNTLLARNANSSFNFWRRVVIFSTMIVYGVEMVT